MKIKPEHYTALHEAVSRVDTSERRAKYERREFPRADKVRDLYKRYRWDCLWASGFDLAPLYEYLDDSHIDSALRKIIEQGAWFR